MKILKDTDCSKDVLQICKIYWLQFLVVLETNKGARWILIPWIKPACFPCHWHLVSLGCDSTEYFCHGVAGYLFFRWIS